MKNAARLRIRWKGMIDTVLRFPLTIILLAAAMVSNAFAINLQGNERYYDFMVTFVIGAFIYAVFQMFYERFCIKSIQRLIFMGVTIILSIVYYLLIMNSNWDTEVVVRTIVFLFILLISFLWIPIIRSRNNFNESFMAAFKSFFMAALFNGVLFIGVVLTLAATNMLLFTINEKAYIHSANVIFILFAPVYFLSLIPRYPGKEDLDVNGKLNKEIIPDASIADKNESTDNELSIKQKLSNNEELSNKEEYSVKENPTNKERFIKDGPADKEDVLIKLITPARFLEALISYVVIPITAVFTIILLLYIITNITGEFWTDNLMEPLLVSYSIVVIIVYLLASTVKNTFARYFRRIFPKVLVPVVLFQTLSSILKISETGITYGRYFVILFGIFATAAGILFCIKPVSKNGMIAPILIVLSAISILPIIGAFTVSRSDQIVRLAHALKKNNMLAENLITPNSDIPEWDKKTIITSVSYLNRMNYTSDIIWLKGYQETYNFEQAFGFPMDGQGYTNKYTMVTREQSDPIPVQGYDFIVRMDIYNNNTGDGQKVSYNLNGKVYTLWHDTTADKGQEIILEENGSEINRFAMEEIFNKFESNNTNTTVKTGEVTFIKDNTNCTLTVIAENININIWGSGKDESAQVYILVKIK